MDRLPDPLVSTAAAKVTAHGAVDVGIGCFWLCFQQSDSGHNLARLAVAALGDLLVSPGFFHRMGFRCPLDGNHLLPLHVTHRGNARAPGFAIDVDRAGAAQALTATEFGAGQLQLFPQHTTAACRD